MTLDSEQDPVLPGGQSFQRRWATTEDWAAHKQTIVKLYSGHNLTLKQVVATMRDKHQFFATEAMYKRRLNAWGISKNVKRKNAPQGQYQQGKPAIANTATATEWPQPRHTIEKSELWTCTRPPQDRERRSPEINTLLESKTPAPLGISCRRPSPGPSLATLFTIESPDDLQSIERWMILIRNYVPAAFEMGLWKTLPGGTLYMNQQLIAWYNRTRSCSLALVSGDSRQAFRALGTCLDEYKDIIESQDPLLILFTLHSVLPMAYQNGDIAVSLFRYVRDIARVVHPGSHPIRLMMEHLYKLGLTKVSENAGYLLRPYFNLICQSLGPHVAPLAEAFAVITRANGTHDQSELAIAGQYHEELINQLALLGDTFTFELIGLRLARAWNLLRRGLLVNSQAIVTEVMASKEISQYPGLLISCHQLAFHVFFLKGDREEALEAAHRRVEYSLEHFGFASYVTIDALSSLESYLRKVGDKQGADQAFTDLVAATDELNKRRMAEKKLAQKR